MTAADWIATRRTIEQAATPGEWSGDHEGWVVVDAGRCTCSPHMGAHEPHCGQELVGQMEFPADAAFIADARTSLPRALNGLKAVLRRHRLNGGGDGACQGYTSSGYGYLDDWCVECSAQSGFEYGTAYPCPTVRAVERALAGDDDAHV